MNEFQKKRLQYFKKAALNYDWVRLAPADVEMLEEAEANEHNFKAADSWQEHAVKVIGDDADKEGEIIELKEALKLRELEVYKSTLKFADQLTKEEFVDYLKRVLARYV